MGQDRASATDGQDRRALTGIAYAVGAFGMWGIIAPVHFKLLGAVPPTEVLAQRIVWATLFVLGLIAARQGFRELRQALAPARRLGLLCLSAALVAVNWLVYIWAVSAGHLVEASLGYFINPLVNVALGVIFLGERLRPSQIAACTLAALGVAILTWSAGTVPWIALALAFSFGFYGLIRKTVAFDPLIGFSVECFVLVPLASIYLAVLAMSGGTTFADADWTIDLLLVLTGVTTSAPLIWFAAAAQRLKLSTLGLMQYIAPSCILLLGVLVYGEPFRTTQAIAFAAIWTALALYSAEAMGLQARFQARRS